MEKFIHIGTSPVKKKYELSFNKETCSFELKIRKDLVDLLENGFASRLEEIFNKTEQDFGIKKKHTKSKKYFGISNCFCKVSENGDWVLYSATVKKSTGIAIACTFAEIFTLLEVLVDNETPKDNETKQDVFLNTTCSKKFQAYGAAMSADLSLNFSLWLYNQDENLCNKVNQEVNDVMNLVFKKLFRLKPVGFCGGLHKKAFLLSPPAGIYTCQFGITGEEIERFTSNQLWSYNTFCHNLDTWQQQLVLLAGFAKICEAFRNT